MARLRSGSMLDARTYVASPGGASVWDSRPSPFPAGGWVHERVPMKNMLWMIAVAVFAAGITTVGFAPPAQAAPYRNCTEAKSNGDCDIPSSSDKYQAKLDRDGDGLGCEC